MKRIESSFSGELLELPGVYVDNFEFPTIKKSKAYFLSHFHTDHTVGLDSEQLLEKLIKEKNVFIYATKMTAAIIQYNYEKLRPFTKVLNLGCNLISIEDSNQKELIINVTLIPAGHCLGSTMFLFETTSKLILYTGDFRIRSNDLPKFKALHDINGRVVKLDALYMDTTFLNEKYDQFPKRADTVEHLVHLMFRWLSDDNLYIVLDTPAKYGYEHVFNEIYKTLHVKVYVCPERWQFYSTIQHLVPGVTNNLEETRIFLNNIPESINMDSKKCKRIRFSAMRWSNWSDADPVIESKRDDSYFVCFSTHCSKTELVSFVEYLKPHQVVGFPNSYSAVASDEGDREMIRSDNNSDIIPETSPLKRSCVSEETPRKDRKVDSALLKKMFGGWDK